MRMSSRMTKTRITASSDTLPAAPRSWPLRTPCAPPVAITRPRRSPRASPGARPAASSGTPPLGLALHQRVASEMRFHIQIMRGLEPRKQLAQPARRLRSKVAHWRSPSFSMTTTKRIGLQCQISTKTRSLLYPDIKPEPGGEQLPAFFRERRFPRGGRRSVGSGADEHRKDHDSGCRGSVEVNIAGIAMVR